MSAETRPAGPVRRERAPAPVGADALPYPVLIAELEETVRRLTMENVVLRARLRHRVEQPGAGPDESEAAGQPGS